MTTAQRIRTVISASLLVGLTISFGNISDGASESVIWACLLVFYGYFVDTISSPVEMKNGHSSFIKIDTLFLLVYYVFYFLPYQMHVLGLSDLWYSSFVRNVFVDQTNKSLIASTIGLVAFQTGIRAHLAPKPRIRLHSSFFRRHDYALVIATFALAVMCAAVYVASGTFSEMRAASYAGSTTNDKTKDGLYFLVTLFAMLASATLIVYYGWQRRLTTVMVASGMCIAAWSATLLVLGDRNSFFLIALVALAGASAYVTRVRAWSFAALIVGALILYQGIEATRQADRRGFASIGEALQIGTSSRFRVDESSFTNTTVTSRAAFRIVPDDYDYFYGKFKLVGLAGIIPYSRGLFVDPQDPIVTSADLLTIGVLGDNPTWSLGTNLISDIYVDFGIVGVLILMYAMGRTAAYIQRKAQDEAESMVWAVTYLVCLATFAETPRYSFDFPVRPLVWTFFGLKALVLAAGAITPAISYRTRTRARRPSGAPHNAAN